MSILVTGAAGFIGYHLSKALCQRGETVIGIDNLNDYYDVQLKKSRLEQLSHFSEFSFAKVDIADLDSLANVFNNHSFSAVVNLAAQAGVRYSIDNPQAYINSNLVGFANVLEQCRQHTIGHLIYASSSSVYGANTVIPFAEHHPVDHPISLYAATKKSNEILAHSYAHLYSLPCTGLRFFTVYGPWGRPDMAYYKFAEKIMNNQPIDVYNHGDMGRDFTYIDDIVAGILRVIDQPATTDVQWSSEQPCPASSQAPYRVYNIGNGSPVRLLDFITTVEQALGRKADKVFHPMQPGDVKETFADTSRLNTQLNYKPQINLQQGIQHFVDWFVEYYAINKQPQHISGTARDDTV